MKKVVKPKKEAPIVPLSKNNEQLDQEEKDKKARKKWLEENAKKFIRVRDDYYKTVYPPDKSGNTYKFLLKISKTTVTDDYTKAIIKFIAKYDDFCLVASHTNYQQNINGFYNQYHKITHIPKKGEFPTIVKIFKHVFGEKYYDFIIDYFTILYKYPDRPLPILLLESNEKNTGKSTVGTLFFILFQDNAIKIGNNDLQSDFNGFWVPRLAIIVDETSLEKREVSQMLKRFSTETGKVTSNEKNKAQREVNFIGKFLFTSNEEGKALYIEKGDPRWAVFKVKTFKENGISEDPFIEEKILLEIPAFIYFLENRELVYKEKKSRMHFDPEVYHTPQLDLYFENSNSKLAQTILQIVEETFNLFSEQMELCFSISNLMQELKGNVKYLERSNLKKALEFELELRPEKKGRYTYYSLSFTENSLVENYRAQFNNNNVHYKFLRPTADENPNLEHWEQI